LSFVRHVTLPSSAVPPPDGLGLGTTAQLFPSHCSVTVCNVELDIKTRPEVPTATQLVELEHDTAAKLVHPMSLAGSGAAT
jgi:hypothetical protein